MPTQLGVSRAADHYCQFIAYNNLKYSTNRSVYPDMHQPNIVQTYREIFNDNGWQTSSAGGCQ